MSKETGTQPINQRGKNIVAALACVNILLNIIEWSVNDYYSLIGVAIQIVISIALCVGFNWMRWLFVAGSAAVIAFRVFVHFDAPWMFLAQPLFVQTHNILFILFLLICIILLLFNKDVRAFFRKKNRQPS